MHSSKNATLTSVNSSVSPEARTNRQSEILTSTPTAPVVTPNSWQAWLIATRPKTLTAALVPVFVGSACALHARGFALGPAFAAAIGALLLQIAANLANDVFDHEKGADTDERLGPLRVAQAGLIKPTAIKRGLMLVIAMALLVGVYLTWVAGPVIVAVGVLSIASAVAYTAGPFPLAYNALGDVFVFLFFGFVAVVGTAFVQLGSIPKIAWWCALPVGALATAILAVNNLRDHATDARAGKRTLAVLLGPTTARGEYYLLLLLAYATPACLVATRQFSLPALLPLLSLPWAVRLGVEVQTRAGRALNATLVSTAKLLFAHGVLFALGIALSAP